MIVKKNNKIILKPDKDVLEFLEYASKEVAKMPDWKKGILKASLLSTNEYERPVVTTNDQDYEDNVLLKISDLGKQ